MKNISVQKSERKAFSVLKSGVGKIKGVTPTKIHSPAVLRQELAYVSTTSVYRFHFGSNAPARSTTLGNIVLGDNDTFAIIGMRILLGTSTNANNRQYRSYGITGDDDSVYNGVMEIAFESQTAVQNFALNQFRDDSLNTPSSERGLVLINPLRIITGQMSKADVILDLGDISGLTISGSTFISVELHGSLGQA